MKQVGSNLSWMVLATMVLCLTACQDKSLGEVLWPDIYDPYFQLTEQWSRQGVIRMGLESEVSFVALLKTTEWREAYVKRYTRLQGLSAREAEKMLADQMQAHAEGLDIVLAVASTYPENARMTHRLSRWRVFLLTPDGQQVAPLEIRPMRWSRLELEAYFPGYHQWQRYYAVRFPSDQKSPLTMVVTGPPGRSALVWEYRN